MISPLPAEEIKRKVRQHYAGRAEHRSCCGGTACCGPAVREDAAIVSEDPLTDACCGSSASLPEAFAGPALGCGSPLTYADVRSGETVLDLGSGAGGDILLAAQQVGPSGRAIGVDMTPEMVWRARGNARRGGVENAEVRLGEIEHLPVSDESVDVVISNCVINLIPDKVRAFREAYRVLKPGGRLVIADIVSRGPLLEAIRKAAGAWAACVAGAEDEEVYLAMIRDAGFRQVEVVTSSPPVLGKVHSITVRAEKPAHVPAISADPS